MARKKWIRHPLAPMKYRLNARCPLLIDEVVWDDEIIPDSVKRSMKKFSRADKQAIWDKTGGRCYYCGEPLKPWKTFSIDHVLARSKGGTDELDNLVPCCLHCNRVKYNRPAGVMNER